MNCEESLDLLSPRMDGELTEAVRSDLEAHLAGCASCRDAARDLRDQDGALRHAMFRGRIAATRIGERVASATERRAGTRAASRLRRLAEVVLAAAAGFLLATALPRAGDPPAAGPADGPSRLPAGARSGGESVGRIVAATGRVEALAPGTAGWTPLSLEGEVVAGSRIRTGGNLCGLATSDGSLLFLSRQSEVLVRSGRDLRLESGRLWSSVARAPDGARFEVEAREARVRALGTRFDLELSPVETVLCVVEGSTLVEARSGERIVRAGERAAVTSEGTVLPPEAFDVVLSTSWIHELLALQGPESAELSRRLEELLASVGEQKLATLYDQEIRALGESCVRPLISYLGSPRSSGRVDQRRRAAMVVADLAPSWGVKDLIDLLADEDGDVRRAAARGLERLTSETFGVSPESWRDRSWSESEEAYRRWLSWWEANRGRFPMR